MLSGEFELAWRESDLISARANPDPNRFWDGRPLAGNRILIRCLHGFGDTLQFVRYVPLIRQIASSVMIEAQPQLKSLLTEACLADQVITWTEPEPVWDQQVEVMELPRIFRTTISTIPNCVPYISVSTRTEELPVARPSDLRIGVVWKSGAFNPSRSVPIEQFARIFGQMSVSFYALQVGPEHEDVRPWADCVYDLHHRLTAILDTARILKQMDMVITVDTMLAHLAGAMAIPVWTLLPFHADWRWMLHRDDSPWYPTMRLFRQPEPDNWAEVMARIESELRRLVLARSRSSPPPPCPAGKRSAKAAALLEQ